MSKRSFWMWTAILYGGLAWTVVSCSSHDNQVGPVPEPGSEFKEMLRSLNWGQDTCYVYGHKTPDVDAVASSLSYARLMNLLGYNCKAKVSSPMNRETEYIANLFGFALPELKPQVAPPDAPHTD